MAVTFSNLFLVSTLADGTARIDFMVNELADSAGKKLREAETVTSVFMTRADLEDLGKTIARTLVSKPIAKH